VGLSPHLVLVGLPGVGKTTIGRLLAKRFDRSFCDFDDVIAEKFGKSVGKIFQEDGEPVFRQAEAMLSEEWVKGDGAVLSPGGGWVANQEAVAHLRPRARIIYLRVSTDEALRRMGTGVSRRPLLAAGDPAQIMRSLFEARKQYYETLADVSIDTDGQTPESVATEIQEKIATMLEQEPDTSVTT
jgi:shikimate kinase